MTTKDSSHSHLHLHAARHADLFEDFSRSGLLGTSPWAGAAAGIYEGIFVPAHLQPPNPEDEDDVVPDQHAAFGIQRATQPRREAAWRDLGLPELVTNPRSAETGSGGGNPDAAGTATAETGGGGGAPTAGAGQIVGRPGLGRGQGWSRHGESAVGVGVRSLPR